MCWSSFGIHWLSYPTVRRLDGGAAAPHVPSNEEHSEGGGLGRMKEHSTDRPGPGEHHGGMAGIGPRVSRLHIGVVNP